MVERIQDISFKIKIETNKHTYEEEVDNLGDFNKKVKEIFESINS